VSILRPGADPPIITPYCMVCDMPVERMQFDVVTSPYYIGIHAQCCGKTSSLRLPIEEMFRMKRSKEKLYIIVAKHRMQGLRSMARRT